MVTKFNLTPALTVATLTEYRLVQNMARFMTYDMSRTCGFIAKNWWMPDNGLYKCYNLKKYFNNSKHKVYIARFDQEIAGFAIITHNNTNIVDHSIAKFFIAAKFQGKKVAEQVAIELWNKYRGKWLLSVIPENLPALKFWRKAVKTYTRQQYQEEILKINYDKDQPYRYFLTFKN